MTESEAASKSSLDSGELVDLIINSLQIFDHDKVLEKLSGQLSDTDIMRIEIMRNGSLVDYYGPLSHSFLHHLSSAQNRFQFSTVALKKLRFQNLVRIPSFTTFTFDKLR
jgi:hypothetical protein